MALGDRAKESITKRIVDTFGEEYVGIKDKKIYVELQDGNNGYVQIAISLTTAKNLIEKKTEDVNKIIDNYDQPQSERDTIAEMLSAFGL